MLSVRQAAAELNVHLVTIYKWIRSGRIQAESHPYLKRDKYRIPRSELERFKAGGAR